jgi:hypothetical protein
MAVADILKDVGQGLETAGKAAVPVLQRVAQVESGEAPQIDAEQRKRQQGLEDATLNAKSQQLETQLEMGRKYGTLTPEQQQQYVDQITGLYSHPRHAGTLMEKLRKAIHPNGAFAEGPQPPLSDATPPGGTNKADDATKEKDEERKLHSMLSVVDARAEAAAKYHHPAGKSPPVPGSQLPVDAKGPDGNPLGPEARDAQHSFVEWNGSYWPVAKPKPVFKTVKGHSVLVDSQSGAILRDLGPVGTSKVTTHQTMQPGDDGQMHLVTLTSVSAPGGEKIEVEPGDDQQQGGGEKPGDKPKTPARKVNPGSLLPKTGAKPSVAAQAGALPGFSNLANKKIQTTQDRTTLESSKQIISAVDNLLPILEKRKDQGGTWDAGKMSLQFEGYKHGRNPSDPELTKIFENSALLSVMGASLWSKIGRSRYTFEIIKQHLPKPTDSPGLMYDKVKWLKENVVPAAQDAIKNPQPDAPSGSTPEVWVRDASGKLVPQATGK